VNRTGSTGGAGTWSSAGWTSVTRVFASAVLLPDGDVLVAGGSLTNTLPRPL